MTKENEKSEEKQSVQIIPSREAAHNDLDTAFRYQASRIASKAKDNNVIKDLLDLAKINTLVGKESREREVHDRLSGMSQDQLIFAAKLVLQKLPTEDKKLLLENLVNSSGDNDD